MGHHEHKVYNDIKQFFSTGTAFLHFGTEYLKNHYFLIVSVVIVSITILYYWSTFCNKI